MLLRTWLLADAVLWAVAAMDGIRDHWTADGSALAAWVFFWEKGIVGVVLGRGGGEPGEHQGAGGEDGTEVHLDGWWTNKASAKLVMLLMDLDG
jgi:hypothetical protein